MCQITTQAAKAAGPEAGSALVWSVFFVALTSGMLIAHSFEMSANRRTMDTRFGRVDRVRTIATSGLTEAAAYLRRQPTQPVLQFAPQLEPSADPPLRDTIDPSIGLVREFQIHAGLWGRYEVRNEEAIDVSASYAEPPGTVWDVGARGYLYERLDPDKPFDRAPNRVISSRRLRTEIRGLPVDLPANAAVILLDPNAIAMLGNGFVFGGSDPAVAYKKPPPGPLPIFDASITGTPTAIEIDGLSLGTTDLFRLQSEKIRNLSDLVITSARQLPRKVIKDMVVFAPTNLDLEPANASLRGRMLLMVDGDMIANAGNNSDFSGIVFVHGNMQIKGPFRFRGTLVIGGQLDIGGTGEQVSIEYSASEVAALRAALSRYRVSRDLRPAASSGAFADPSDLDLDFDAALR